MATPALPTPPRRKANKENSLLSSSPTKGIQWSEKVTKFFYSPSPGRNANIPSSSPTRGPRKSILKPTEPLLPLNLEKERETTPQPDDPLSDTNFLVWPISMILDEESTLRQLTEAYSVLAARIRSSLPPQLWVPSLTEDKEEDTESRYALFEPMRTNAEPLTRAMVRDLQRVFVDPYEHRPSSSTSLFREDMRNSLPSPRETPSPRKGGMSEEQVKFARDLSTVTNSVLKFLALAFQVREIYGCFTEKQLREILDAALEIPLAPSLRSPSARKMYSFTMSLLASQRLPLDVVTGPDLSTRNRIMRALRRAILGELGREGKKGSVAEGLKAVYELSTHRPESFVPAFLSTEFLPVLLDSLISPVLALRVHAAHAVGGLALAITQFETCDELRRALNKISPITLEFFLRKQPVVGSQSTILRALRASLSNQFNDATLSHHAQAPFWGLSVLLSLIILLGPAALSELTVLKELKEALDMGLKSRKRCVRIITTSCWGGLAWSWRTWRHSILPEEASADAENEGDAQRSLQTAQVKARTARARETFVKILSIFSTSNFGISLVGILLGQPSTEPISRPAQQDIIRALAYLEKAGRDGGESTPRVLDALDRLINARGVESTGPEDDEEWESNFAAKLAPRSLLSVFPGLLSTDITPFFHSNGQSCSPGSAASLSAMVESIVKQQPSVEDLRAFSEEERKNGLIWKRTRDVWLGCIEWLQLGVDEAVPEIVTEVWAGLIKMGLAAREGELDSSFNSFAEQCAMALVGILDNANVDLRESSQSSTPTKPKGKSTTGEQLTDDGSASAHNMRLKLNFVRSLWSVSVSALPESSIRFAGHEMIKYLVYNYNTLVPACSGGSDSEEETHRAEAMNQWATLFAQVAVAFPPETCMLQEKPRKSTTVAIWEMLNGDEIGYEWTEEERSAFWRGYTRGWMEGNADDNSSRKGDWVWKGSCVVLGLPFGEYHWNMSDADLSTWNSLLRFTIIEAEKYDFSVPTVLEYVAEHIDGQHIATSSSTIRIAEYLLSGLDRSIEICGSLPVSFVELVHDIMITSYPPHPRFKLISQWLIRSLQVVIEGCPTELLVEMLERMQEGICTWIGDECDVFGTEQYSSDIIPLYQTILVSLQSLPPSVRVIQNLESYFSSALQPSKIADRGEALSSFREFWIDCCKQFSMPRGGWAIGVSQALAVAFPKRANRCSIINMPLQSAPYPKQLIDPCSEDKEDELNAIPLTSTPRRRNIATIPLPSSPCARLKTPPKRASKIGAMRPRRSGIPRPTGSLLQSPSSPSRNVLNLGRVPRMRAVSGSGSPVAKNNGKEKENMRPEAVLGKRRIFDDFGSPKSAKRRMIVDLEEKRWLSRSPFVLNKGAAVIGSDDSEEDRAEVEALIANSDRTPLAPSAIDVFSAQSPVRSQGSSKIPVSPGSAKRRRVDIEHIRPMKMSKQDSDAHPSSEDEMERSSSPVGPFTPTLGSGRIRTYGKQPPVIQMDPPSDDSVLGSSPTRPRKSTARIISRPSLYA